MYQFLSFLRFNSCLFYTNGNTLLEIFVATTFLYIYTVVHMYSLLEIGPHWHGTNMVLQGTDEQHMKNFMCTNMGKV